MSCASRPGAVVAERRLRRGQSALGVKPAPLLLGSARPRALEVARRVADDPDPVGVDGVSNRGHPLDRQTDESLWVPVVARNTYGEAFELPLGETMVHVVDHATYHRGQINAMIASFGPIP